MKQKLEKNVLEFIEKCSTEIGKYEKSMFDIKCTFGPDSFDSPIETILYYAIETLKRLNEIQDWDTAIPLENGQYLCRGLDIRPQENIGKYRVDFLISYDRIKNNQQIHKEIIIECDSQEWHERTEKERRYEKMRDRFLQKEGYKIFRYTGSEIIKNAFEIALEILSYLTDISEEDLMIDSNIIDE